MKPASPPSIGLPEISVPETNKLVRGAGSPLGTVKPVWRSSMQSFVGWHAGFETK